MKNSNQLKQIKHGREPVGVIAWPQSSFPDARPSLICSGGLS